MKRLLISLLAVFLLLNACMKEEISPDKFAKTLGGERSLVIPVSEGTVTLKDIFDRTNVESSEFDVEYEGDTIAIYYVDPKAFEFEADDYLSIPEQEIELDVFNLGFRNIEDVSITDIVTLGDLVNNMGEPQKTQLTSADGLTAPFPPIPNQNLGVFNFDTINQVDSVVLSEGDMSLTIENNFPVAIDQATFEVKNKYGQVIGLFEFNTPIQPGTSVVRSVDLEGRILTNAQTFEIISYTMSGSATPVPINFLDEVMLTFAVTNATVRGGRAILPDQLFNQGSNSYEIILGGIEEISFLKLRSGSIAFSVTSFIQEDVEMVVTLPNTFFEDGSLFEQTVLIDKELAQNGLPFIDSLDLSGTETWLTNNMFPVNYSLKIVSSGDFVEFNFPDSITNGSFIEQKGIIIESAKGYFGQDTINFGPDTTAVEFELDDSFEGNFTLTNPTLQLFYSNRSRVPVDVDLEIIAEYDNKANVNISINDKLALPFEFASESAVFDTITYNTQNTPGLADLLSIPPPTNLIFQGSGFMNPQGQSTDTNFVHNHDVEVGVLLRLPLEFNASNVILTDTFNFDFNINQGSETEVEVDASMLIKMASTFPLEVDLSFIFYDSISPTEQVFYDTVEFVLPAAPVDDMGIAIESEVREILEEIELTREMQKNFENKVDKMILVARLNTTPDGNGVSQDVKVLTTSKIDFHIGIDGSVRFVTVQGQNN